MKGYSTTNTCSSKKTLAATKLTIYVVLFLVIYGYVANFFKLVVYTDFQSPYKAEFIRALGLPVAPLGVVLGYITIDDPQSK